MKARDLVFCFLLAVLAETLSASVTESRHVVNVFDADQFNAVLERVAHLERVVKNHPSDLVAMETKLERKFNDKMSAIQGHYNAMLTEQRLSFEKQMDDMKQEIESLKTSAPSSESKPEPETDDKHYHDNRHTATDKHNDEVSPDYGYQINAQRIRRSEPEAGPVGFFATRSTDLPHQGQHQAVIFDRIVTNTGGAYNANSGIFTAPVTGLYIFSTTVVTHGNENTRYGFHKNGSWLSTIKVTGSANNYDDGSETIVLRLTKGDVVMVGHIDSDHILQGGNVSIFSGALLSQIYNDATAIIGK